MTERKVRILGRELGAEEVGVVGLVLILAGVLSANELRLAIPLLVGGLGAVVYSAREMKSSRSLE